jgi:hypothetical protein
MFGFICLTVHVNIMSNFINTTHSSDHSQTPKHINENGRNQWTFNLLMGLEWSQKKEFEDTKGVIRIRKSKNRQHNGKKKKYKRTNNDLQNIHK